MRRQEVTRGEVLQNKTGKKTQPRQQKHLSKYLNLDCKTLIARTESPLGPIGIQPSQRVASGKTQISINSLCTVSTQSLHVSGG